MLFISIRNEEFLKTISDQIDGIELRLDLFPKINLQKLKHSKLPLMFTLRKRSHGGCFQGSEEERKALIQQLLSLNPAFFDLEYDMDPSFLQKTIQNHPNTKFILSYHNFQNTPENLEKIYEMMITYQAYGYKIATLVHSANDALKMLLFSKKHPNLSVICMGELGKFARILGKVVGNLINYCALTHEEATAPGQPTLNELLYTYNYPILSSQTTLYGLIGDPIEQSQGHIYHNKVFQSKKINALYVKMNVKPEELSTFLSLANKMGFLGLSVTMPLKETVLSFLDHINFKAKQMGAVNTLSFKSAQIFGNNTDGEGALDALEKRGPVNGKKIIIIGTGGAARGIAFEALNRGANVLIAGRDREKAENLASSLQCKSVSFLDIPQKFDILINCSADSSALEHLSLSSSVSVMDINYNPRETVLLTRAQEFGCSLIYGEEMFFNQAAAQIKLWI